MLAHLKITLLLSWFVFFVCSVFADVIPIEGSAKQVDLSGSYSCAITVDSKLYCWGDNLSGQIGNNTSGGVVTLPTEIQTDVKALSLGGDHTCAIDIDNKLWCWGKNTSGQVGINATSESSNSPIKVLDNVRSVSLGLEHSCAVTIDDKLYCWGKNEYGQIGDGTNDDALQPTIILENISSVTAGTDYTCAITTSDELKCWGSNAIGKLGNGNSTNQNSPVSILSDVKSVALAIYHTCAIKTDDTLHCWGSNVNGRIGDGTTTNVTTPKQILTGVSSVKILGSLSCAITTAGKLLCWGENKDGQVGNGEEDPLNQGVRTPTEILSDVSSVSLGISFACAIKTNGELDCWGNNSYGKIGNGSTETVRAPVRILGDVAWANLGGDHTCAVTKTGKLYCWGNNESSQIGNGVTGDVVLYPREHQSGIASVSLGYEHTCAIKADNKLSCWGYDEAGQVGDGEPRVTVLTPTDVLSNVSSVGAGASHTCAVNTEGVLYCWGSNLNGQLGNDSPSIASPLEIRDGVSSVAIGKYHSCVITTENKLLCWGKKFNSASSEILPPTEILSDVQSASVGGGHACAVKTDGKLFCWGANISGQLGDGSTDGLDEPTEITSIGTVSSVSLGWNHSCAVKVSGELYCWGSNSYGQIGNDSTTDVLSPLLITTDVRSVSLGDGHTCAVKTDDKLYCWGNNEYGQLGDGTITSITTPSTVIASDVSSVSLSGDHTCIIKTDDTLYCWGNNEFGQSDGRLLPRSPVEIFNGGSAPENNDCSQHWNSGVIGDSCDNGMSGACLISGEYVCYGDASMPSIVCNAVEGTPVSELCDGIDNDCDDETDEDFPDKGADCHAGVGECLSEGINVCKGDGSGTECNAVAGTPRDEVCDGRDNDCDNATDEDFPKLTETCSVGVGACATSGTYVCKADGTGVACDAIAGTGSEELCDGIDNDCNGEIDEAFPDKGTVCTVGEGACANTGVYVCKGDGSGTECSVTEGTPSNEVCDGIDNDCNGEVDEAFPDKGTVCTVGTGACANTGVYVCKGDGSGIECSVTEGTPSDEVCDGIDNDCNGEVDETFTDKGTVCTVGTGACANTGVYVCKGNGSGTECSATEGTPSNEVCDGIDNDCNGEIDEAFPNKGTVCTVGTGVCTNTGVYVCKGDGSGTECSASEWIGSEEICDGLDNDCNGEVDETFTDKWSECTVGVGACANTGVYVCKGDGSGTECSATEGTPSEEICDGIDNDCNGEVDETFTDKGSVCSVGKGACRGYGVYSCKADGSGVECNATEGTPSDEICDAVDNDCDGEIDEDFTTKGQKCSLGIGACQSNGVFVCNSKGDGVVCDAIAKSTDSVELCDGVDNDCDGEIDEGFDNVGEPCSDGEGACKVTGIYFCSSDGGVECSAKANENCVDDGGDSNKNGIPDIYEAIGERIVRPNSALAEPFRVKKRKLLLEWFSGASLEDSPQDGENIQEKFRYKVNIRSRNILTKKVRKVIKFRRKNNVNIKLEPSTRYYITYRVIIGKGMGRKVTRRSRRIVVTSTIVR